jgi:hypothetical protein
LAACQQAGVEFVRMDDYARELLANRGAIPVRDQVLGHVAGHDRDPVPRAHAVIREPSRERLGLRLRPDLSLTREAALFGLRGRFWLFIHSRLLRLILLIHGYIRSSCE